MYSPVYDQWTSFMFDVYWKNLMCLKFLNLQKFTLWNKDQIMSGVMRGTVLSIYDGQVRDFRGHWGRYILSLLDLYMSCYSTRRHTTFHLDIDRLSHLISFHALFYPSFYPHEYRSKPTMNYIYFVL